MSIVFSYMLLTPFNNVVPIAIIVSSLGLFVSHHLFAHVFKLYKRVWSYASIYELKAILKAVTLSIAVVAVLQVVVFGSMYTRALIVTWMLHVIFIGGSRFMWRMYRDTYLSTNDTSEKKRTLIIGAGFGGSMVGRQLTQSGNTELNLVGYIDDDPNKQQLAVFDLPVLGTVNELETVVQLKKIEHIIIAIPSLSRERLHEIFNRCTNTNAKTQIMPRVEDLASGKVSVTAIRDVQVEDLLGRDPVELDISKISNKLSGKTVLVTGAGGSIGSEICRQVANFKPAKLILLGHGENSIYEIERELKTNGIEAAIQPVIADIQDRERIEHVMMREKPDVIYHAAAHKHVPLMEQNAHEAVKNNVMGTKNVAKAADKSGVSAFVMVSTDKAVNPTSIMGATKRLAEMVVQHMNKVSDTRFVAVRFGNVLGSRGSVIPLFKKQIAAGGPVTVTDPDMTRYFMTIPEASRLVIQAGALADGGEIFVLDMGEPVKIVDLAKNLIKLSGYDTDDIGIKYTGMRPGEKLYEELLSDDEVHGEQIYPQIYRGKTAAIDISAIERAEAYVAQGVADLTLREYVLEIAGGVIERKEESLPPKKETSKIKVGQDLAVVK
nr:nucleoside-diphosphate sugar epimerase/dehydratase [Texcoconibacillus texcoconensis]